MCRAHSVVNEVRDPAGGTVLGSAAVVAGARDSAEPVEEPQPCWWRDGDCAGGGSGRAGVGPWARERGCCRLQTVPGGAFCRDGRASLWRARSIAICWAVPAVHIRRLPLIVLEDRGRGSTVVPGVAQRQRRRGRRMPNRTIDLDVAHVRRAARERDRGDVAVGVVDGMDLPFDRLRAGSEVGKRLDEHPAGGILGEALGGVARIGPGPKAAHAVAQAGHHRQK